MVSCDNKSAIGSQPIGTSTAKLPDVTAAVAAVVVVAAAAGKYHRDATVWRCLFPFSLRHHWSDHWMPYTGRLTGNA